MAREIKLTRFENPKTGEVIELWVDVVINYHDGGYETPEAVYYEYEIMDWGEEHTNNKPDWITEEMIYNKLF